MPQPRDVRVEYRAQPACPLCGGAAARLDELPDAAYEFGELNIPFPEEGPPRVMQCIACSLVYKSPLPTPRSMAEVLGRQGEAVWSTDVHFAHERELVLRNTAARGSLDILDVGAGDGGLLAAFHDLPGRRSALDVVPNERCRPRVRGEYVMGALDGTFEWSANPYDAVLAFDVLEHVHRPREAWRNLAALTKPGGVVVAQTGDGDYPARAGLRAGAWRYLRLFEHTVCWPRRTLRIAAAEAGFEVVSLETAKNKEIRYMPGWKRGALTALATMEAVPGSRVLGRLVLGRNISLLADPSAEDHLTAVFRRL